MRRTLLTLSVFGIVTAGYIALKDKISFAPNVGHPNVPQVVASQAPSSNKKIFKKGESHENRNRRSRSAKVQRTRPRASERASDESSEIESLASIYQDQEAESERSAVNEETSSAQPSSPIPGVKVAAWLSSKKNEVPREVPDPSVGDGMRYFLNCMELKDKHLSPLEAKECSALITDRRYKN